MKLNGKVTIIAGFPSIGKSYAEKKSLHVPGLHVLDFDSGDFKEAHSNVPKEKLDRMYVEEIISNYYKMRSELLSSPYPEDESYVLLVSCHENIRNMIKESGLDFIIVAPTMESFDKVRKATENRFLLSHMPSDRRASDFLESPAAKEALQKIHGTPNDDNQITICVIDFGESEDQNGNRVFNSLFRFLMECHNPSEKFLEEYKISERDTWFLSAILTRYLHYAFKAPEGRPMMKVNGDPIPYESKHFKHQVAMDHNGRIIMIAEPKYKETLLGNVRNDYLEIMDGYHPDIRVNNPEDAFYDMLHVLRKTGYFGLDSILVKKNIAKEIVEIIKTFCNILVTDPARSEYIKTNIIAELETALNGDVTVL